MNGRAGRVGLFSESGIPFPCKAATSNLRVALFALLFLSIAEFAMASALIGIHRTKAAKVKKEITDVGAVILAGKPHEIPTSDSYTLHGLDASHG